MELAMKKHDYAEQVRQINCTSGYFHRFYELTGETRTHKEAWERLEGERHDLGLNDRYKNYESFKVGKSRYLEIKVI